MRLPQTQVNKCMCKENVHVAIPIAMYTLGCEMKTANLAADYKFLRVA